MMTTNAQMSEATQNVSQSLFLANPICHNNAARAAVSRNSVITSRAMAIETNG